MAVSRMRLVNSLCGEFLEYKLQGRIDLYPKLCPVLQRRYLMDLRPAESCLHNLAVVFDHREFD